ncbi:MAG TPA: hypothetical protein VEH08_01695 [Methanomassiliicoccales archaeon]|nr:hypothetical protein [Methanomassiliicoccales archaeon]
MDWIDENVAVGGWMDAWRVGMLRREEIDLIIDARTLFHRVPWYGGRVPYVDRVKRSADLLLSTSSLGARVLVRCRWGKDRTPFVAMMYVSRRYNLPLMKAYELVKQKRPQTRVHLDWVRIIEEGK